MAILPQQVRSRAPARVRDDVRLRALGVGLGLIPPRTMHSADDARVLLDAARGARRVVEIGVYEGSSALQLLRTLGPQAHLHLIDPFGRHPDALAPEGGGPASVRHAACSTAPRGAWGRPPRTCTGTLRCRTMSRLSWTAEVDLVFIDGDHSEAGCETDWLDWSPLVAAGGHVVFHDARADQPGGRGLPGPTAVVARRLREDSPRAVEIVDEADRTVAVRRNGWRPEDRLRPLDPVKPRQNS